MTTNQTASTAPKVTPKFQFGTEGFSTPVFTFGSNAATTTATTTASSPFSTFEFDVGGTIYKVSKTLLDRHPGTMLARMVSPLWNQSDDDGDDEQHLNNKPIFIERDGHRFRYVLDYMRDNGLVYLPPTVPLEAFLNELAYYGFQDSEETVKARVGSVSSFKTGYEFLETVESNLLFKREATERMLSCIDLALVCFREYKYSRSLTYTAISTSTRETASSIFVGEKYFVSDFNRYLQDLGLKMSSIEKSGNNNYKIIMEFNS